MSLILCLETSTKTCSVSLGNEKEILGTKEIMDEKFTHSENLLPFIEDLLKLANVKSQQLDGVCVSKGPGSYTGLRIGTSVAKGICYAAETNLLSINSLEILTRSFLHKVDNNLLNDESVLIPMIDARRMEVYTAQYNKDGNEIKATETLILDENSFKELGNYNLHFFGDGANKCKILYEKRDNCYFYDDIFPSAKSMIKTALKLYSEKKFEDVAYFEPYYLKDFVATTPKKIL